MNTTVDREKWLRRSLEVLQEEGIQGVRVERLARDLGITKGSFYWHFSDRDDLKQSILEFWSIKYNDVILEDPEFVESDSEDGLLEVVNRVRAEGLDKYELAMRAWADHDTEAARVVQSVYERRRSFVRSFFTRLGFRGPDAEARSRLALCYLSWEPNMYLTESEAYQNKVVRHALRLLVSRQH